MKEKLTVGYLTSKNPKDKRSWSGTHFKMYESLMKEVDEVYLIAPIKYNLMIKSMLLVNTVINQLFFFKRYDRSHSLILSKFYASQIKKKLENKKIDVIFAPVAATEIAYLESSIPICYLSDSSFGQLNNYYDYFSNISDFSFKEGDLIEKYAIKKAVTHVYSSTWAAEYVINNYKVDKSSVFTVKFGANLDFIPQRANLNKEFNSTINFLFLGVDWERKGGAIVVETFRILINKGYDITLTICGCIPNLLTNDDKIKIVPFLDKNKGEECDVLVNILQNTHLLFVPTRADCTPIVFCEANAFGIPVITTDTGGVTSIIENGINGFTLPLTATPADYVAIIQSLLDDRGQLSTLALNARKKFENELNWDIWGRKMREILRLTKYSSKKSENT